MYMKKIVLAMAAAGFASGAYATNGMNIDGYGPIAEGMGGASMAYDNGNAAMMNNPATLGLAADGSRVDIAVGGLHPIITTYVKGTDMSVDSDGTAYLMPAMGWTKKSGNLTYGVGMFAQGGMGTKYDKNTMVDPTGAGEPGLRNRSEVGVGRVIFPVAYNATPDLTVAGSLDVVWAGMDIKMALQGDQFGGLMSEAFGGPAYWMGSASGPMTQAFGSFLMPNAFQVPLAADAAAAMGSNTMAFPGQMMQMPNWAYLDFSDSAAMTGEAKGYGVGGKLGMTYKVNNALTIGMSYHSETNLGDWKGNEATMKINAGVNAAAGLLLQSGALNDGQIDLMELGGMGSIPAEYFSTFVDTTMDVYGKVKIRDFQWPATFGLGMAYKVNDRLMLVADYKWINWKNVMEKFRLTFEAEGNTNPMTAGLNGLEMDMTLNQNWKDQNVFMLGGAYKASDKLTLRAGVNLANNPIPDGTLNPLFPATTRNTATVGMGYAMDNVSDVNFSFTYAPEVTDTNPNSGISVDHAQINWQLMYSRRF